MKNNPTSFWAIGKTIADYAQVYGGTMMNIAAMQSFQDEQ